MKTEKVYHKGRFARIKTKFYGDAADGEEKKR